tara:strand:- start:243 stop:689 length:447 start_codon:yes stop_codon:yes gene_type:complete
MFYEQSNLTDDALSAVGFLAPLTGDHALRFNVLEDEMLVEISCEGTMLMDGVALLAELGFQVDALAATKLWAYNQGVADTIGELRPISFKRVYRLARGEHVVTLLGEATAGSAPALNGTAYPTRMSVMQISNSNVLAANANAKRAGIY